jgi:hypothetical protein
MQSAGIEAGQCWVCGAVATVQCDYDYRSQAPDQRCKRPLCPDHATVEAQLGDPHGADGVDTRCSEHTAQVGTVERVC